MMDARVNDGLGALTEKEKQTLRLMVRGHDAKSIARSLGLSVHTINERLRDARRKMAVSSSREAARLLLATEGEEGEDTREILRDMRIGEDVLPDPIDQQPASITGARRTIRRPWIIGGFIMTLVLGLLALAALPQSNPAPPGTPSESTINSDVVDSARRFLMLVDQSRWNESYQATGTAFRKLNTLQVWTDVSEKERVPLGAVLSRTAVSQENLPAPPAGYEVVKFRTSFTNKPQAMETVSLEREDGKWRIVGVTID